MAGLYGPRRAAEPLPDPPRVIEEIDVRLLGVARTVCCYVDRDEGWLVDPGPQSCEATLLEGLGDWAPERILLTHIHFDHAGATGALLRRWPGAEVWVHERGARHLADPERLVASARRIYGEDFDRLWGEVTAVPEDRLVVLSGGERRDGWEVAYTPGHASHHVAYLHPDGTAFCGDVAGVRILDGPVLPPTPPPDIDLDLWAQSIRTVAAWEPRDIAVTHFGRWSDVTVHLEELVAALERWGRVARETDAAGFARHVQQEVEAGTGGDVAREAYTRANPPETLWAGLDRYWAKKAEREAADAP
jgi:glyoxylase-like metal-dependent hydrolase (beta-lactamase superfamily II)